MNDVSFYQGITVSQRELSLSIGILIFFIHQYSVKIKNKYFR